MKNAFTLIELLIVIVIIAILATIAVPFYQGIIWKARFGEVYQTIGALAKAELIYYQEHGNYTQNPTAECYAGYGITPGSTGVQKDLNITISNNSTFRYLVYPSTTYPAIANIYFSYRNYGLLWYFRYNDSTWHEYNSTSPDPGRGYFNPPSW